ncbi:MAG: hypothetical protein NC453_17270 [Muribaculum sp.]|nr:hypothetical protein [Muribaculum sp.]
MKKEELLSALRNRLSEAKKQDESAFLGGFAPFGGGISTMANNTTCKNDTNCDKNKDSDSNVNCSGNHHCANNTKLCKNNTTCKNNATDQCQSNKTCEGMGGSGDIPTNSNGGSSLAFGSLI